MYINRRIKNAMDNLIDKYPILTVTGPRQSGKTTFIKSQYSEYQYVNLENPDIRNFAYEDPNGFLKLYNRKVVFDEVQRVPYLFSYLQSKVDESNEMGQYILSGSQNFQLIRTITQSLAGRVALFKLFPFDFEEMKSADLLSDDYSVNLQRGFYPAIFKRDIPPDIFFSNYIQTYIERDLTELINIKDLNLFRNFISMCASRAGQLLNLNSLANECGVSQPTAKSWLSVLQSSYIVFLLQPYFRNFNKRITKSAKLYFYDTGLLCHLLKIKDYNEVKLSQFKGHLFENFIISELVKNNYHKNQLKDLLFWRDSAGHEVDLMYQDGEYFNIMEIKSNETIMNSMFKGLFYYENLAPHTIKNKLLIHTGLFNHDRSSVKIISWKDILNFN